MRYAYLPDCTVIFLSLTLIFRPVTISSDSRVVAMSS